MTDRENGTDAASEAAHTETQPNSGPAPPAESACESIPKADHWNQLASVLGAEVREEEPAADVRQSQSEDESAPMQDRSPARQATQARSDKFDKPRRPRPPANWDALANSLGVEPPAEPAMEQPAPAPDDQPEEPLPQPAMSTGQLAEEVERLSEFVAAAPASLGHEPTVLIAQEGLSVLSDVVEEGEDEGEEEADTIGESEEPARGRSKHRRRRKPRTGERPPIADDSAVEPPAATEMAEEGEAFEVETDEGRRSKRRRPRRRRQKSGAADDKTSLKPDADSDEIEEVDDLDTDAPRDSSDRGSDGDKPGHRSIPVWQEAVGIIVEKNLQSRSAKPGGAQSQKRGGRRSGRRGGSKPG